MKVEFSLQFKKNAQISNFIKIRSAGAEFRADWRMDWGMDWRTDWRTDMTKLIFALRNFANAPKNGKFFDENCGGESDNLFQIACNYFCVPGFTMACETHWYK